MNTTRIGTVAAVFVMASLLVPAGAALPAQAHQQAQDEADDHAEAADEVAEDAGGQPDTAAAGPSEARGPPVNMPGNVPAFVTEIHSAINSFLDGEIGVETMVGSITAATPDNETAAE